MVIVPGDASVEIEGVPVRSKDGVVELTGTLGSVHNVRVFKGKTEIERKVIITETGALPAKLELKTPSATGAPGKAPPPAAASSERPPTSSAVTSNPLMPQKFQ
jgi:serine/threonine-protein kinase